MSICGNQAKSIYSVKFFIKVTAMNLIDAISGLLKTFLVECSLILP